MGKCSGLQFLELVTEVTEPSKKILSILQDAGYTFSDFHQQLDSCLDLKSKEEWLNKILKCKIIEKAAKIAHFFFTLNGGVVVKLTPQNHIKKRVVHFN